MWVEGTSSSPPQRLGFSISLAEEISTADAKRKYKWRRCFQQIRCWYILIQYILCKASKTGDAVRIECPGLDRSSCSCGYCGCCAFGLWLMTTAGACHRTQAVMYGHALRSLCDCFVSWTVSLQVLLPTIVRTIVFAFLGAKKWRAKTEAGSRSTLVFTLTHMRDMCTNDLCSGLVAL